MKYRVHNGQRLCAAAICLLLFWSGNSTYAALQDAERLIPLGQTAGISLAMEGVKVVGLSAVQTANGVCYPAKDAGIQEGDILLSINGTPIDRAEDMQSILQAAAGDVSVRLCRGETELELMIRPETAEDGRIRIGVWVRDDLLGIGTLTFYDPESGKYGALGHGINDQESGKLVEINGGDLLHSAVEGVKRGCAGTPGELQGSFEPEARIGSVEKNTSSGIFGQLEGTPDGTYYPVAKPGDVELGEATILSCVAGEEVREYAIRIAALYHGETEGHRDMLIEVTDPDLIAVSGGIVQGMSGSPILQNGAIVGAVTHVLVNEPTKGYGILIGNMLEAELAG